MSIVIYMKIGQDFLDSLEIMTFGYNIFLLYVQKVLSILTYSISLNKTNKISKTYSLTKLLSFLPFIDTHGSYNRIWVISVITLCPVSFAHSYVESSTMKFEEKKNVVIPYNQIIVFIFWR